MTTDKSYLSAGFDENILRDPAFYDYSGAPYDASNIGELIGAGSQAIGGDLIQAGAVTQDKIEGISILGWMNALTIQALSNTKVSWLAGAVILADGTTFNIQAGDTGDISAVTYVYLDKTVSTTNLQTTTTALDAVGANKILILVAQNVEAGKLAIFQTMGGNGGGNILITADNIAAGTITTNELAANSVKANNIDAGAVTAVKIAAGTITADKIATGALVVGTNVGQGTAVSSGGVTTIINNTVTTGWLNAKYITAGSVNAENIGGTYITGKVVRTSSGGSRVQLNADTNKLECFDGGGSVQGAVWGGGSDFFIWAKDNLYFYAGQQGILRFGTSKVTPAQGANNYSFGDSNLYFNAMYANDFNNISDRRLKKNIKTIESALDKVKKLRGVSFNWKKKSGGEKRQIGMIAQEVEKVVPEIVNFPEDEKGNYTISYGKTVGLLVEAIKELNFKIDKLSV